MKFYTSCPVCNSKKIFKKEEIKDHFLSKESFSLYECKDCQVLFTNPRPEDKELGKYYDSKEYLSHSTKQNGIFGKTYALLRRFNIQRKYQIVQNLISIGKILDIGCGTGELLNFFQQRNWECEGIEPNIMAKEFAKTKYHLNVNDESHIRKIQNKSFDIISMWHVLEHVPNINKRMEEVHRLLKNNGYLIIAIPNLTSWDAGFYKTYWAGYDVPRHLYHFTPEAFQLFANKHNLQIIDILPLKLDSYYVSFLSEKYLKNNFQPIRAFWNGLRSNLASRRTKNYSSLIYVLKKF